MSKAQDISYLRQISSKLDRFVEKSIKPFKANCRCPKCGDSQKKLTKARFWAIEHPTKDSLVVHCFNCGFSQFFSNFLKDFDLNLYNAYRLEKYRDSSDLHQLSITPTKQKVEQIELPNILKELKSMDDLEYYHPAKNYIIKRGIHEQFWSKIFYAPKFFAWARKHEPELFERKTGKQEHSRIIIPWFDKKGKCVAYSARAMGNEEPKYYKIKLDKTDNSFFGEERLKYDRQIYVVEGPVDSLFLPNCIAVGNANIGLFDNDSSIYIPDRDVRNTEVMDIVEKLVNSGKKVFLAPPTLKGKDINEYLENGITQNRLLEIIQENTYQGLEAKLYFTKWRKIKHEPKRNLRWGQIQQQDS